jgi:hypothetical protein
MTKEAISKLHCNSAINYSVYSKKVVSTHQKCFRSYNATATASAVQIEQYNFVSPKRKLIPQNFCPRLFHLRSYNISLPTKTVLYFSTITSPPSTPSTASDVEATTIIVDENFNRINQTDATKIEDDDELVLYVRDVLHPDAMRTTTFMRSGFVFSTFHTLYWFWYTFDFIPHVNKATMEILHVDPMIGVAGIVFAMSLQSAFVIYPLRLISKLTYRIDEQRICVYTHRLPNMYPSLRRPYTTFLLGTPSDAHNASMIQRQRLLKPSSKEDITSLKDKAKTNEVQSSKKKMKYFTLDTTTPVALNLIQGECQGDLSKYRGQLVVGPTWPKYILDIKDSNEVKESALLLQALIKPEHFYYKKGNRQMNHGDDITSSIRSTPSKSMSPYQLRIKSRQRTTTVAMKHKAKKRRK